MKPEVDQPENPLFTNGENWNMNACVGDNGGPYTLFQYSEGFFESSHETVDLIRSRAAKIDLLIYPIAFSYRHGIELMLKQLLTSMNNLLETGEGFKKRHQMSQLWGDMLELAGKYEEQLIEPEAIERAGVIIGHFDDFDPTGQVFRYPEDIKGNRHLSNHKLINVEVLQTHMKELQEILRRWYYQIEEHYGWMMDGRADMGDYYQ
ncbi:hypothetical protein HT136_23220 [Novosphingobium profundi]|uniref:hypothetical protein n=1 Tax=Novosphingobium profundi TaxID=1774954 RepID=UPI001BDA5893|nr:hypothetical protein [Novosphingobium profundi]MBT0671286.1 hypothetical protein [Novosphingobium profundi]